MRVLHNLDNSNRGGIQEMILRLHRYSRHQHDFWAADGSMADQMRAEGMALWPGGPPPEAHYDVVVGHTVGGWSGNQLADWTHARGARFVECLHSVATVPTDPAKVDAFVALSSLAMRANPAMTSHKPGGRWAIIYAPIDENQYGAPSDLERKYIGRLSRLAAEKRPQAFAELAPFFPEETFLLAGEGPEASRINTYPNLFLVGWVDPTRFYDQLKLFVFPTHDECCCVSVAQAQMAGVPVICQDLPALRETTGGLALFCNSDAEFRDTIRQVLDGSLEFISQVQRARVWAVDHFGLRQTIGSGWDDLIDELAQ